MIEWKGLFANTPYSSANNKTQDDAVVGMQDTIYVTGPGYGGYSANVRVHNASGAVVALIPVCGGGGALSAPAPVRILDDSTTYSYSLEVVRGVIPTDDADKIVIRIIGGASKRYPGQTSTLPDGSTSFAGPLRVEGGVYTSRAVRLRAHLSRRVRWCTCGYSIDNVFSGTNFNTESIVATIPGGATASQPLFQGTKCGVIGRTKKLHLVGNCGVSGETTAQIIARSATAYSTSRKAFQDGASMRPDLVTVAGPLVNDGQTWTEATTTTTVDESVELAKIILENIALFAPNVAFCGCMGINPTGWTGARKAYVQGLMVYAVGKLAAWAETKPNIRFLNPEGRLSVGQSWISTRTSDGIHPNNEGGGIWADMIEELVDDLWGISLTDPVLYDYNKDWSTVVSGKPTGVSVAVSGGTTGLSTATANGVMEVTFTANSATDGVYVNTTTIETVLQAAGLLAGSKVYWEFDVELLNSDRSPVSKFQIDSFVRLYNAANEAGCIFPTMSNNVVTRSCAGFCTPVIELDRDAANLGTSCDSRLTVAPMAQGTYILRVFPPQVRKYTTGLAA